MARCHKVCSDSVEVPTAEARHRDDLYIMIALAAIWQPAGAAGPRRAAIWQPAGSRLRPPTGAGGPGGARETRWRG
jgi:hypothetical protein